MVEVTSINSGYKIVLKMESYSNNENSNLYFVFVCKY